MKVTLLNPRNEGDFLAGVTDICLAGHVCKRLDYDDTVYRFTDEEKRKYIKKLIELGHESVLEHFNFTFYIEDISRALLQELARHRHISLSVESTRSALQRRLYFIYPKTREKICQTLNTCLSLAQNTLNVSAAHTQDPKGNMETTDAVVEQAMKDLIQYMQKMDHYYNDHLSGEDVVSFKAKNEFFKYLLPEVMPVNLVLTLNLRELRHILKLRSEKYALPEFRVLCWEMVQPEVFPKDYHYLIEDCIAMDLEAFIRQWNNTCGHCFYVADKTNGENEEDAKKC
mgnify:FL=1